MRDGLRDELLGGVVQLRVVVVVVLTNERVRGLLAQDVDQPKRVISLQA